MAEIVNDIIKFRSTPEHFYSEQSGIKKYTAREIENLKRDGITADEIFDCRYIEIVNAETGKAFTRRLKTVLPVGTFHLIFSW